MSFRLHIRKKRERTVNVFGFFKSNSKTFSKNPNDLNGKLWTRYDPRWPSLELVDPAEWRNGLAGDDVLSTTEQPPSDNRCWQEFEFLVPADEDDQLGDRDYLCEDRELVFRRELDDLAEWGVLFFWLVADCGLLERKLEMIAWIEVDGRDYSEASIFNLLGKKQKEIKYKDSRSRQYY